jgi:hypothetical protein
MRLTILLMSLGRGPMATTITLTDAAEALVAALARQRPGVSRHRMGLALLELGLEAVEEEPERLDAQLAALVEASERRRKHSGEMK